MQAHKERNLAGSCKAPVKFKQLLRCFCKACFKAIVNLFSYGKRFLIAYKTSR